MLSKTAQADVEDMWENGLKPTFADIIRLNALALEVERKKGKFALSKLPRVAFLGDVSFREPTIGSEVWFASASRLFNTEEFESFVLLRAFSLSMSQDKLPDPIDEQAVINAIQDFKVSLAFATLSQILAAIGYAIHGFSPDECEKPAKRSDRTEEDKADTIDCCYEIGLLRQGMVCKLGNASELKNLQPYVLREMVLYSMANEFGAKLIKDDVSDAEDDYLRTLDEITDRLRHDSSNEPHKCVKLDDEDGHNDKDAHQQVERPIA